MKQVIKYSIVTLVCCSLNANADEKTVTLSVAEMTCPSCDDVVKNALEYVKGVSNVEVSLPKRMAIVTYEDSVTNIAALINITKAVGFTSRQIAVKN